MKMLALALLVALHAPSAAGASFRRSAPLNHTGSLVEQEQRLRVASGGGKLIPWKAKQHYLHIKKSARTHLLARSQPAERDPVKGCIACFGVQIVYGKYQSEDGDQTDNSYFLFKNPQHKKADGPAPVIIHFHSGGFFSGSPWKKENSEITAYLSKGFAVISVGYRMVTEKYFFKAKGDGTKTLEELIHVDSDGMLTLDKKGKSMEDYKVRIGKQEFITKYLYDSAQMIEHLIDHADEHGLDIHKIVFVGESAGGAGMHYLTWVYHGLNVGRYTPRGMVYQNAQLNYPEHNMLDEAWSLFVDTMGQHVKLADVVSPDACPSVVGNHMCGSELGEASDYELCNKAWHEESVKRFCGDALKSTTIGEVQRAQKWPEDDKEVGKGMEKLWYNSQNMQKHVPFDPFYIYVANSMNGTSSVDVAHHSISALNFAKFSEMGSSSAIQYTVYYTDFHHMTEADRGMKRLEVSRPPGDIGFAHGLELPREATGFGPSAAPVPAPAPQAAGPAGAFFGPVPAPAPAPAPFVTVGTTVFNYLSTHDWREHFDGKGAVGIPDVDAGSTEEQVLYACLAAGVGPFKEFEVNHTNTSSDKDKNGVLQKSVPSFGLFVVAVVAAMLMDL